MPNNYNSLVLINLQELGECGMTLKSVAKRCSFIQLFRVLNFQCFRASIYMDVEWFDSKVAQRALTALKASKEGGIGLCIDKGIYIDVKIFQEDIANEIDNHLEYKFKKSI